MWQGKEKRGKKKVPKIQVLEIEDAKCEKKKKCDSLNRPQSEK